MWMRKETVIDTPISVSGSGHKECWVVYGRIEDEAERADDDSFFVWCNYNGTLICGYATEEEAYQVAELLASHGIETTIDNYKILPGRKKNKNKKKALIEPTHPGNTVRH
jgi:hypothetical protein